MAEYHDVSAGRRTSEKIYNKFGQKRIKKYFKSAYFNKAIKNPKALAAIYVSLPQYLPNIRSKEPYHLSNKFQQTWPFLLQEIDLKHSYYKDYCFESIYIEGYDRGSTPLFEIEQLLSKLHKEFHMSLSPEITIESTPDSPNLTKMPLLKKMGINRVVLKAYGLSNTYLQKLRVNYSAQSVRRAIETIFSAGFNNLSADVTYGKGRASAQHWFQELSTLASLGVPHITAEAFIPNNSEDGPTTESQVESANFDTSEGFAVIGRFTKSHGYLHYDVINMALTGYESRQNLAYTYHQPCLGLGPGAEGYTSGCRWHNFAELQHYTRTLEEGGLPAFKESLTSLDMVNEHLLLGLRSRRGIQPETFIKPNLPTNTYLQLLKALNQASQQNRLRKSPDGSYYFNPHYWLEVDDWLTRFFVIPENA